MVLPLTILGYLLIFLGVINLLRITFLLVGSDLYSLLMHLKMKKASFTVLPKVSIVIPAYNEEKSITTCLNSIFTSNYPKHLLEVIVVDDGSQDKTRENVIEFINRYNLSQIKIITQTNAGKAHALNRGMKDFSTGELIMCLDADSYLDENAIRNASAYFNDDQVMAVASNVKIVPKKGLLNLVQRYEYLVCYQMKRAQTFFNIEYIIGGIGSTFRKSFLEQIGYYDVDTVTEDIDMTMKILRYGNKNVRVMYGANVIAYTQAVLTIPDLITQRFRWKWGRYQTFWKNRDLFFSTEQSLTWGLSWIYLPFALFCDISFFFEPLLLGYILFITITYRDIFTLASAFMVMTFYTLMNVLAENTISLGEKVKLIIFLPFIYFLFYLLSAVEYIVLIKSWLKLPQLSKSLATSFCNWKPVQKVGFSAEG